MHQGNQSAQEIITRLNLRPHPEGGHYREIFRSSNTVQPLGAETTRSALTSIYFLLEAGDFSAYHRVASDEVWHVMAGGALELHTLDDRSGTTAQHHITRLTADLADAAYHPQAVVPAGVLQAARPAPGAAWVLATCLVAPGFDFADFEMPPRAELLAKFPNFGRNITELTRATT